MCSYKYLSVLILATCISNIGCQKKETPTPNVPQQHTTKTSQTQATIPESLLDAQVSIEFAGGYGGAGDVTLRQFLNKMEQNGFWKRLSESEWIYRVNTVDKVTERTTEVSMLFIHNQEYMVLSRIVINGVDATDQARERFFNQIYSLCKVK
jgi:hypothetical protein